MELVKMFGDGENEFVPTKAQESKLRLLMERFSADRVRAFSDTYEGWVLLVFEDSKNGEWCHYMTVGVGPEGDSHT